ncbi:lysosome-associated membrane glycoprotein 1-like [Halichondria panicea]|uniref:lysosome-associated membrane glycoprotein 1-like n=1 Tax=Halichondria panicea TaxID=6063 RepID=UPI00312BAC29
MARLLSLLSLAAMLYIATGQTASVTPSAVLTTDSNSMVATTSMVMSTSSMMPSPTPAPPTPEPTNNNYFLRNPDKTVCLRMMAGLSIEFTYLVGDVNRTTIVDLLNKTIHNDSTCDAAKLEALLKLEYTPEGRDPYFVSFIFQGYKADKTWNVSSVLIEFKFTKSDFPGFSGTEPSSTNVNSTSLRPLFDGGSVNLNQSFGCDVNRTFSNFVAITPDLHVSLFMMDLQVQAFDFTNATSGVFDSAVFCVEQNTGNKIVPIAVGAALAGLVIVVLIAYLIGRLRNRKKSSYEALS